MGAAHSSIGAGAQEHPLPVEDLHGHAIHLLPLLSEEPTSVQSRTAKGGDEMDAEDIDELLVQCEKATDFGYQELRMLLAIFDEACGEGGSLTRERFKELFPELFLDELVGLSLFRALDVDGDGGLEFLEVCKALTVIAHGNHTEKAALAFEILDLDSNGSLDVVELRTVARRNREAMRRLGYADSVFGDPDEMVDRLFTFMGEDGGGELASKRAKVRRILVQSKAGLRGLARLGLHGASDSPLLSRARLAEEELRDQIEADKIYQDVVDLKTRAEGALDQLLHHDDDVSSDGDSEGEESEENADEESNRSDNLAVEKMVRLARSKKAQLSSASSHDNELVLVEGSEPAEQEGKQERKQERKQGDKQERKKEEQQEEGSADVADGSGLGLSPKKNELRGGMITNSRKGKASELVELRRVGGRSYVFTQEDDALISTVRKKEKMAQDEFLLHTVTQYPTLSLPEFVKQSVTCPDIVHCFGLFPYLYKTVVERVERSIQPLELEEDSFLFGEIDCRRFHTPLRSRHFAAVHGGFMALYPLKGTVCPATKDEALSYIETHVPRRVISLPDARVTYCQKAGSVSSIHLKGLHKKDKFSFHFHREQDSIIWLQLLRTRSLPRERANNRFASFSPLRENCKARWFMNAAPYYLDLLKHIQAAQHEIMIAGWWVVPHIFLKRGGELKEANRLREALKERAESGVKVYILMWKETGVGLLLGSLDYKRTLAKLHKNITVLRHPRYFPILWSHHQKLVIIDRCKAYVGGVDLAYMRYDNSSFRVTDPDGEFFPGRDYGNLCVYAGRVGDPCSDQVDRSLVPRMPWHDIHMTLEREAVVDLVYNFVQRWNLAAHDKRAKTRLLFCASLTSFRDGRSCLSELDGKEDADEDDRHAHHRHHHHHRSHHHHKHHAHPEGTNSDSSGGSKLDQHATTAKHPVGTTANEEKHRHSRANGHNSDHHEHHHQGQACGHKSGDHKHHHRGHADEPSSDDRKHHHHKHADDGDVDDNQGDGGCDASTRDSHKEDHGPASSSEELVSATCQVVRSICEWSGGVGSMENSIYRAYVELIKNAKHYVLIENQYFISSISSAKPRNQIARAIFNRVCEAIENKETFRVRVIIPIFPAGSPQDISTRYIIHWIYATISRNSDSLLEALSAKYPGVELSQYISFFSLRNWGQLPESGTPTTEQVYIHSKMMIVDDRSVIIGSANINDRSMEGSRDSEICVVLEDTDLVPSTMNGESYEAGKFARSLRMSLTQAVLGLSHAELQDHEDPVGEKSHNQWLDTADLNFGIYTSCFRGIPENSCCVSLLRSHEELLADMSVEEAVEKLNQTKGFLTWFPQDFLIKENNAPSLLNPEFYVPLSVFI